MPKKPPATTVVSEVRREQGRKSAAGRARDEKGRLLPRNPAPPPAKPPAEPAPPADDAPRFSQVRRRWSPIVGRGRTSPKDPQP